MKEKELCFVCGEYENPYTNTELSEFYDYVGTDEHFIKIWWLGKSENDSAHIECWEKES